MAYQDMWAATLDRDFSNRSFRVDIFGRQELHLMDLAVTSQQFVGAG